MNGPREHNAKRHQQRVELITRLADRAELTELIFRVGLCLDEHRFEDLADLFVEDGVVVTPAGAARGRAALVAHAARSNAQYERMQHVTTNVLIDFDGDAGGNDEDTAAGVATADRARIRANIVAHLCEGADPNPVAARGGVSLGKAVRTPKGWRLTELEARPIWATQPREHTLHG
jgi:hypothetical protein